MSISYKISRTADVATQLATDVATVIGKHLGNGLNVYLYLSGGSAINAYTPLANILERSNTKLENLQLAQVDERYDINPLHKDSNQKAIIDGAEIIQLLAAKGAHVRWMLNAQSVEIETASYNRFVSRAAESQRTVQIAILGIGEDGHIAGIKPGEKSLFGSRFLSDEMAVSYESDDFPLRMTLTIWALQKFEALFVYAIGEQKRRVLLSLERDESLHKSPVHFLKSHQNTAVYTDV